MSYQPLFITGLARSGSSWLARMLAAHPEVMVASDPYFPLMRSLRNAMAKDWAGFDPQSPFQDYYFTDDRVGLLDLIQETTLDIPFDMCEWNALQERLVARAESESPDLSPRLSELQDSNYKRVFDRAIDLIAAVRQSADRKWVGFKEVWVIELFRALARAYPTAQFVVIMRDPRAIVWSMLALAKDDSTQLGHVLSYARHWRKFSAFVTRYQSDPLFAGRFGVVRYEDLVERPNVSVEALCAQLQIPFSEQMLDARCYIDYRTNLEWKSNSSFTGKPPGNVARSWRESLSASTISLLDLVCGPEMELLGYPSLSDSSSAWRDTSIIECLREQAGVACSWRSDLGSPELDYAAELARRAVLEKGDIQESNSVIRRNFLFREQYLKLIECKASHRITTSYR